MKKKLILVAVCLLGALFALTGCGGNKHTHNWSKDWSDDATNHWHECLNGCDEKGDLAAHYDDNNDGKCDACNHSLSTTPPVAEEVTLYFYNAEGWEEVYAYTYNDAEEKLLGEWPGTKTEADTREGWVKIKVDANPVTDAFNIIFNNNDTLETRSIVVDDATNVYLIDKADAAYANYEAAEEAYSETPVIKETVTIHYHKAEAWGETVKAYVYSNSGLGELLGGWGEYTSTAAGEGWYTIQVSVEKGRLEGGDTFNLIIYDADNDTQNRKEIVVNSADEIWVASDGQIFESKEAVETYESAEKTSYTIYYYAPDWPGEEAVYLYTYGGTLGEIGGYDATTMTAVADHEGWYSHTFETALEVTGFSVIFHTAEGSESAVKHEFYVGNLTGKSFYFIHGLNNAYADMEAAQAAYEENKQTESAPKIQVTFYLYAPDWKTVGIHTYNGYVTGDWGSVTMTADTEEGWWTYTFEIAEQKLADPGVNVIFFDKDNDTEEKQIRLTTYTNDKEYVYFNASKGNDNKFTSKDAALAEEEPPVGKNEYTFYFYAPEAATVTVSVWGNFANAFADNTPMTEVADHEGWYSYTFKTDKELAENFGINLNLYADSVSTPGYTTDAAWVYFVAGIADQKWTSFADAEAAYGAAAASALYALPPKGVYALA